MITKKEWDSLPLQTKREILSIIYGEDFERFYNARVLLQEYHHNFDFDDTGRRLKSVLKQCYHTDVNTINVRVDVKYCSNSNEKFLPTPKPEKKKREVKQTPTNNVAPLRRKHWQIDYDDKDGDLCHIHCYANSKEEARDYLMSEYWNVGEIIQIYELKD